jgi:hypothetical protein
MNIVQALVSLRPGARWTLVGDSLEGLEWLDEQQLPPTQTEIEDEIIRLTNIWESNEYQRQRQRAYPPIEDQLDRLYHEGIEGWKAMVDVVKNQYPKP